MVFCHGNITNKSNESNAKWAFIFLKKFGKTREITFQKLLQSVDDFFMMFRFISYALFRSRSKMINSSNEIIFSSGSLLFTSKRALSMLGSTDTFFTFDSRDNPETFSIADCGITTIGGSGLSAAEGTICRTKKQKKTK